MQFRKLGFHQIRFPFIIIKAVLLKVFDVKNSFIKLKRTFSTICKICDITKFRKDAKSQLNCYTKNNISKDDFRRKTT